MYWFLSNMDSKKAYQLIMLHIICGNKMPTRCNRWFLLQILLLAQHVSGTTMPIIRSSRVLYKWLLPVVFGALAFKLSVWCGAEGYVSGVRAADDFYCRSYRSTIIQSNNPASTNNTPVSPSQEDILHPTAAATNPTPSTTQTATTPQCQRRDIHML